MLAAQAMQKPAARAVDFDREVRPILSDNCFFCHGPDEKQRQAGLRLDTREGAFARAGVIVPGDAKKSRLYVRISAPHAAVRMPPPASNKTLAPEQIGLIRDWIDQGAKWETHWSFVPPQRPEPPAVKNEKWPRNAIDRFILARLEREGLKPSPEAAKTTLIRRVTLDLTGLPPTLAEVDAFLKDRSPDAYEKLVDHLLASPRYGERMAMQWLDLARYADTHGYHIDSHRDMWIWRDWVVNAFNRNLPYDRFTVEQLAGDLLPHATIEQRIASGFNRNHMINFEGGAIAAEYLNEYLVDRVEATSTAWLGLTFGCARCHDHKYDPLSQREFYRLYAFFNTVPEKGLDGRAGNAEPFLQVPSPAQKAQLDELASSIEAREKQLPEEEIAALQDAWEKGGLAKLPPDPRDGLLAHYELDGNLLDSSGQYRHGRALGSEVAFPAGQIAKAADFTVDTRVDLGAAGGFDSNDRFTIALWARSTAPKSSGAELSQYGVLQKIEPDDTRRGWELTVDDSEPIGDLKRGSHFYFRMIHRWPDEVLEVRTRQRLQAGAWHHLAIEHDGSGKAAGVKLHLNGEPLEVQVLRDALAGPIKNAAPLGIGIGGVTRPYRGQLDDIRLYGRLLSGSELASLAVHDPVRALLFDASKKRTKEQKNRLRDYFLTYAAPGNYQQVYAELMALEKRKAELDKVVPTVMVMEDMPKPRETHVLARGDYRNKGETVTPGVPSALPPWPAGLPKNRLGLAKWLTDPSHPLTARVAVNRFWQMYFGHGIVKTAEDFGSQGEAPVHPELLDWLATEFVRGGWDVKAMQRLIVTSAAYRQSSRVTPELLDKDPENRLLARGPRFRVQAETVRDIALAAGGLLNGEMGGPGVYPYQPKGVWEDIAYGDVFSAQSYAQSHGKDLYRRSLYTFWKRTAPPPNLITFDAPDREKCSARRSLTNTPLQALVLMNDPTFVESARALALRVVSEAGRDPSQRIRLAYRLVTAREPQRREMRVLRALAAKQLAHYRHDRRAAVKLLGHGESPADPKLDPAELAAWTTVASTVLSLDEAITKE
ncbi:MAG: DUF1553 domain-containing protein [Acidobacteria bacterium]|nr:DUF1553 domain-containing protein [Acidobacteriota bacterium]